MLEAVRYNITLPVTFHSASRRPKGRGRLTKPPRPVRKITTTLTRCVSSVSSVGQNELIYTVNCNCSTTRFVQVQGRGHVYQRGNIPDQARRDLCVLRRGRHSQSAAVGTGQVSTSVTVCMRTCDRDAARMCRSAVFLLAGATDGSNQHLRVAVRRSRCNISNSSRSLRPPRLVFSICIFENKSKLLF